MSTGRVTERTFYPALRDVIRDAGGSAVQEVYYNSQPDLVFQLNSHKWLLSVKIGQDNRTIKDAVIQYWRHKEESGIPYGLVLFLPNSVREIPVQDDAVSATVRTEIPTVLIDAHDVKEELGDRPFPGIVGFLREVILARLARDEKSYYPLGRVVSLLQEQVAEMMRDIELQETDLLDIITDRDLLMDLGHLKASEVESVARFLASYILMSQILFLRLLFSSRRDLFSARMRPATHHRLRRAFERVLDINYRPIYSTDVLDSIPEQFLEDTFDLIWGLEIERVRYELPGRIFHELMPDKIRKMLAAFYTRPQAADVLANLSISRSDATVFDLACGSGTILTSAYRRKSQLFRQEGKGGNPHKRFCEEEIFGADIMPFAVHLTSANLAALEVSTSIDRTQIIQRDSLDLVSGDVYEGGIRQLGMFHEAPTARTMDGETYDVTLDRVDVVLMNPPFTKVERGISEFVNMGRFADRVGGEVGLWGHFIALGDLFLEDEGIFGAVIPINVLRGRESSEVREILFTEWTPLYILKPTMNYAFSEWAEYRDVLLIARKEQAPPDHEVRFALVKEDLTDFTEEKAASVASQVRKKERLRSDSLDIESFRLDSLRERFANMMWFCGVTDFEHREILLDLLSEPLERLEAIPEDHTVTGYRPDGGTSKFLFLTRHSADSRIGQAFLRFRQDTDDESDGHGGKQNTIVAESTLGVSYRIPRSALRESLRTPVGISTMNVTDAWDYLVTRHHEQHDRICRASGFTVGKDFDWSSFWSGVRSSADAKESHLVVARRINPFSPSTSHFAFYSDRRIAPNDQLNVVRVGSERARAMCALLNSSVFVSQFFLLMEESTGRYVDVRLYDLSEMELWPSEEVISPLAQVFDDFGAIDFPSLRDQFDQAFNQRYDEFKELHRRDDARQERLWSVIDKPVEPSPKRLNLDLRVCKALGVEMSESVLLEVYEVFVKEMMAIQALKSD